MTYNPKKQFGQSEPRYVATVLDYFDEFECHFGYELNNTSERLRTAQTAEIPFIIRDATSIENRGYWHLVSVPGVTATTEQMRVIRRASEVNRLLHRVELERAEHYEKGWARFLLYPPPSKDLEISAYSEQLKWLCNDAILSRDLTIKMVDLNDRVLEIEREVSVTKLDRHAKRRFGSAALRSITWAISVSFLFSLIFFVILSLPDLVSENQMPEELNRWSLDNNAYKDAILRITMDENIDKGSLQKSSHPNTPTLIGNKQYKFIKEFAADQLFFSIFIVIFGALLGRTVAFLWFYRQTVTSEEQYYRALEEIPHFLGPIRDIIVAVVIYLIAANDIVKFDLQLSTSIVLSEADKPIARRKELVSGFVLGFLVGLALPLVVDRLMGTSKGLFSPRDG